MGSKRPFYKTLVMNNDGIEKCPSIVTFEERNINILEKYMRKYPTNVMFLRKNSDDGSQIIFDEVPRNKIINYEIIGVNTEHCVIDTAIGLAQKIPDKKIIIRQEGCGSNPFSRKKKEDIIERILSKIVNARADNIHVKSKDFHMETDMASHIHTQMTNMG